MHAEHVHQNAQKLQRAPIGLDHHGLGQSPPTDIFWLRAWAHKRQFQRYSDVSSNKNGREITN